MRYSHRVLVLIDSAFQARPLCRLSDSRPLFPGSRLVNYLELLIGFGIPHDTVEIGDLRFDGIVGADEVRYSAVLLTFPLKRLGAEKWSWVERASFDHGVTLVADSFLLSGEDFARPFGVRHCPGLSVSAQRISGANDSFLYRTKPYPYSPHGMDVGLRPVLRMLMQSWISRRVTATDGETVASFASGMPAIVRHRFGRARNCLLNFHPSLVLREANPVHALLREILESGANVPGVSIDLAGLACLRLDDPGSCERAHLDGYNPGVLSTQQWDELLGLLSREDAHLNVAYVPQWVDDGNPARGSLNYQGQDVESRVPGKHYNSWQVVYSKAGAPGAHDYASEYRAIRKGVESGTVSIVSHGLTHLTTDVTAWLGSRSRYTKMEWYREFREMASGTAAGPAAMLDRLRHSADLIAEIYGRRPEIIVPAAHEATAEVPGLARKAGFRIFASRSTMLLWADRTVSNRKLSGFYPTDISEALDLVDAGYPTTLIVHDYDILRGGAAWIEGLLAQMKQRGVVRFASLAEIGFLLLARLRAEREGSDLRVTADFSDSIAPAARNEEIRIRVRAKVSRGMAFDRECPLGPDASGDGTVIRVPVSALRDARLELCLTLAS